MIEGLAFHILHNRTLSENVYRQMIVNIMVLSTKGANYTAEGNVLAHIGYNVDRSLMWAIVEV